MDYVNNKGEKIGSLTHSVSNDTSITINRIHDVTIVSTRDRNTGEVTTETFIGEFAVWQISREAEGRTL